METISNGVMFELRRLTKERQNMNPEEQQKRYASQTTSDPFNAFNTALNDAKTAVAKAHTTAQADAKASGATKSDIAAANKAIAALTTGAIGLAETRQPDQHPAAKPQPAPAPTGFFGQAKE